MGRDDKRREALSGGHSRGSGKGVAAAFVRAPISWLAGGVTAICYLSVGS